MRQRGSTKRVLDRVPSESLSGAFVGVIAVDVNPPIVGVVGGNSATSSLRDLVLLIKPTSLVGQAIAKFKPQ